MRASLFARLFLTIGGCTTGAIAIALVLQDHSLGRNLDHAAQARVERAARAAATLLQSHIDTTTERYAVIARSPRTTAIVDETDLPTLTHRAEEIRANEGAIAIAFLDPSGAPTAVVGDRDFDPTRSTTVGSIEFEGQPAVAVRVPVRRGERDLGTLVALEPIAGASLRAWSGLIGAEIVLEAPSGEVERLWEEVPISGSASIFVTTHLEQELAAQAEARWTLLAAGFLALGCALVVSAFLSRGFTRPILAIRRATEAIGSGDFTVRVSVTRRDEIGDVAHSVNGMADRLELSAQTIRIANETLLETNATLAQSRDRAERESFEKSARLVDREPMIRPVLDEVEMSLTTLEGTTLPEAAHRAVETLRRSTAALRWGIDGVLDLARIETDRLELDIVDFSPGSCAEDSVAACAAFAASHGVRLASFVDPNTPAAVRGDPRRFAQLVTHLVRNAIEHARTPEVVVAVQGGRRSDEATEVQVRVTDRGVGIPARHPDDAERTAVEPDRPTGGIGLAIVEHLCARADGHLSVDGRSGGGTVATATLRLPTAQWQDSPLTHRLRSLDLETLKILVHDPAPLARKTLLDQVRGWGVTADVEEDATQVVERARRASHSQDPYHLVLVALPAAIGATSQAWFEDLLASFENRPSLRGTRLVALAPTTAFEEAERFAHLLTTPVRRERLLDLLAEVRGGAPRRDARTTLRFE